MVKRYEVAAANGWAVSVTLGPGTSTPPVGDRPVGALGACPASGCKGDPASISPASGALEPASGAEGPASGSEVPASGGAGDGGGLLQPARGTAELHTA